ncbi:N-acetylmuramoyl-L-alanine amidase [Clostridium fungisolvens]|uniref:LysM domain-containing protein n=1 Tax=Clostridium fungisolvens TaxID=1604897 RepID=A0A6V8SMJ9_9CLOT|nr:N-acetylmuramoyl-L-alanine amidase [Clostridium fungisolvens]GFP76398.1 hypothetical protein bsdtw1_02500 [Clostridium fungisolvens]
MSKINTIAIDIGHNVSFDGGAVGLRTEDSLNLEVGRQLIDKLRATGLKVIECLPQSANSLVDSLSKRVQAANDGHADFFVSIHHNYFEGAHGTEILCITGGRAEEVTKIILPEITNLGFTNRGVKDRRELYVLKNTNMSAILIECAFCDSPIDMNNYSPEKMAEAIFRGICKAFEINGPVNNTSSDQTNYYTVVKGDTLYSIAKRYGTTVQRLVEVNDICDANVIRVGERMVVR